MATQSARETEETTITLTLIQGTATIKVPNSVRIRRLQTEAEETNVTLTLTREKATIKVPNSLEVRRLPSEGSSTIIEVVAPPRSSKLISIVRLIENVCLLLLAISATILQMLIASFPPSAKQDDASFPPSAKQDDAEEEREKIDILKGFLTMFLFISYAASKYLREHLESLKEDVLWPVLLVAVGLFSFGKGMGIFWKLLFQLLPMFGFVFKKK